MMWDAQVARAARREALIEEAFDQADDHAGGGDFERALEWLSSAEDLAGGLCDEYTERRRMWVASLAPLAVVTRR
jgi:hypothetical protein